MPLEYGLNEAAEISDLTLPRYIRITDFGDDGRIRNDTFRSLPVEIAKGAMLEEGDVLFARSGATVGKSYIFTGWNSPACFAGYLVRARTQAWKLLPKYLYYFTKSYNYDAWKSLNFTQATIQNISATKYASLRIPLPPRPEQERIAAFLDEKCAAVDKAIEVKRKQLESIAAIWKNLLYRATTQGIEGRDARPARPPNHTSDGGHAGRVTLPCMVSSGNALFPTIPRGWRVVRIKSIGTLRYGLGEPPETSDDGIPMIRATDFRAGKIDDSKMIRVNPADVPEGRDAYLRTGEIIVVRSGAYAGDSTIIPAKYNGYISGYDMVVTITKAVPEFIAYAFLSKHILDDQLLLLSLRAAQPHVNAEQVLNLELPLPPKEEQRKIAEYLTHKRDCLDSLAANLRKQIETLEQYRKSLIHEYVTGARRVG